MIAEGPDRGPLMQPGNSASLKPGQMQREAINTRSKQMKHYKNLGSIDTSFSSVMGTLGHAFTLIAIITFFVVGV